MMRVDGNPAGLSALFNTAIHKLHARNPGQPRQEGMTEMADHADRLWEGKPQDADLTATLKDYAEVLPPAEDSKFADAFERYADARVVLLGEATHGTHEFYAARTAITRRLVERHGFNIVAVEGDWPDIARLDDYVRHRSARPRGGDTPVRFPAWMWRNHEVLALADSLREYNSSVNESHRAGIYGLDVYSLSESIEAVLSYLGEHDPQAAAEAVERYSCLSAWRGNPQGYGLQIRQRRMPSCEEAVVGALQHLLRSRMSLSPGNGEQFFDAEQNARIIEAAEQYYRAMYRSGAASWNLRDRHMFGTLQRLMAHRHDARAVVWAHNSHVGDASATAMGWRGEFNIGELARHAYGTEAVLIGFGTDRGEVIAASDWGGLAQTMRVRPARDDSWEGAFRGTGLARSLTDWRGSNPAALRSALSSRKLERAIGVVYRPESERSSHYFEAVLANQFDAFVWFEESGAVRPLETDHPRGAPELWPFGL